MSAFDALSFDLGSFIFPSWTCVGGLFTRLAFTGLWPLVLIVAVALVHLARAAVRKSDLRAALPRSLTITARVHICRHASWARTWIASCAASLWRT